MHSTVSPMLHCFLENVSCLAHAHATSAGLRQQAALFAAFETMSAANS